MDPHHVFVTGATGFLGRPLVADLLARGHTVRGLVRPGATGLLPAGADPVVGDALVASSFASAVPPADTIVHLVGTPRPNPAKAAQFRAVADYIAVRQAGEALIRASGLSATILRPWYVLGPGHRWPYLLLPFYTVLSWLPPTRGGARRLGLVTRNQMVRALVHAVEHPAPAVRVAEVPEIRAGAAA